MDKKTIQTPEEFIDKHVGPQPDFKTNGQMDSKDRERVICLEFTLEVDKAFKLYSWRHMPPEAFIEMCSNIAAALLFSLEEEKKRGESKAVK